MSKLTRREFVKGSVAAMATITIAGTKSSGRVLGANDTVRVACAGLHGRGSAHVGAYGGMQNVAVTYLVDPDSRTFAARLRQLNGAQPRCVADIRRALEDRNADAVSIATPNHPHVLMTLWVAQANKQVYAQTTMGHHLRVGRIHVDMAL